MKTGGLREPAVMTGSSASGAQAAPLRTVLVFAHECAPYHRVESTIGAQRVAHFARMLPEFGWRAVVLCCDASRRGEPAAPDLADEVRRPLRDADARASVIIAIPSLVHAGVLDRIWRALLPHDAVDDRVRALLRKPLTAAKLATGDYSQAWQPCARAAAAVVANEVRIDACLAEHTPDAGLFLARWFAATHDVPWIADFRDPILQPYRGLMRRLYRPIARRLLRSAAGTVNVTPVWAAGDAELTGRASTFIPNGYDEEEWQALEPLGGDGFRIVFTGNAWREMRPELFLEGLSLFAGRLAPADRKRVYAIIRGGAHDRFAELARGAGVSDLVDARPAIARREALRLMRGASILLLLSMDPSVSDPYLRRGIYPGKTFEYFGARRPILCVPGDGGVLDELLTRTRSGTSAGTPEAVADRLGTAFREWRAQGFVTYAPVERELGRYSRRSTTRELARVLDEAVAAARPGPRAERTLVPADDGSHAAEA